MGSLFFAYYTIDEHPSAGWARRLRRVDARLRDLRRRRASPLVAQRGQSSAEAHRCCCRRRAGAAVAFRTAGLSGDRNDGGVRGTSRYQMKGPPRRARSRSSSLRHPCSSTAPPDRDIASICDPTDLQPLPPASTPIHRIHLQTVPHRRAHRLAGCHPSQSFGVKQH